MTVHNNRKVKCWNKVMQVKINAKPSFNPGDSDPPKNIKAT